MNVDRPSRQTTPTRADLFREAWVNIQPKRSSSLPTNSSRGKCSSLDTSDSQSLAVNRGLDIPRALSLSNVDDVQDLSDNIPNMCKKIRESAENVVLSYHLTSQIDISSSSSLEENINEQRQQPVIMRTEKKPAQKESYLRSRVKSVINTPSIIPRSRSKSPAIRTTNFALNKNLINGSRLYSSHTSISSTTTTAVLSGSEGSRADGLRNDADAQRSEENRSPTNSKDGSESSDKENRTVGSKVQQNGAKGGLTRSSSLKQAGSKKTVKNTVHFKT